MPSKSPAQARLMAAAAHTPGGYGGVPQSVGREFNRADAGTGIRRGRPKSKSSPLDKAHKRAAVLATGRRGMASDHDGDEGGC